MIFGDFIEDRIYYIPARFVICALAGNASNNIGNLRLHCRSVAAFTAFSHRTFPNLDIFQVATQDYTGAKVEPCLYQRRRLDLLYSPSLAAIRSTPISRARVSPSATPSTRSGRQWRWKAATTAVVAASKAPEGGVS